MERVRPVTERDRAHFERIAQGNREMELEDLRATMELPPGVRIARALSLSDAYLGGTPSPEREAGPSLAARWRALGHGGRRP